MDPIRPASKHKGCMEEDLGNSKKAFSSRLTALRLIPSYIFSYNIRLSDLIPEFATNVTVQRENMIFLNCPVSSEESQRQAQITL